jgi:hypothetical protein
MEKHNILDKRVVKLEEISKKDFIPFLSGRPDRTTVINNDDILNLRISLNTTNSVDELLALL